MKKGKIISVATLVSALFMTTSVLASEGETATINFTGKIVQDACTLDSASKSLSVPLGDVSVSALAGGAGKTSQDHAFQIGLENCTTETAKNVTVSFKGDLAGSDANILTTDNVATTNVGIQILQDGTPLAVDGSAVSKPTTLTDGAVAIPFTAHYVSIGDAAAGDANGVANFTVNYD